MSLARFVIKSLRYHAGSHLGTFVGMMIGAAVLTGALLVGESVRRSLREMGLIRLGHTHYSLTAGDRLFRKALADDLLQQPSDSKAWESVTIAPVLALAGTVASPDGSARANQVSVLGVEDSFWRLALGQSDVSFKEENTVFLNSRLSNQLKVKVGDALVFRISKPSDLSADAPLAPTEDLAATLRLTVAGVIEDQALGRFSLRANQIPPFNAFVSLDLLQGRAEADDQVNMLLAGSPKEEMPTLEDFNEALRRSFQLEDLQLKFVELQDQGAVEIRSDRVFLEPALTQPLLEKLDHALPILTYFVNGLNAGDQSTPYSMVSAVGSAMLPIPLANDEILISDWLREDLSVAVGQSIDLIYYSVGLGRELIEKTNRFSIKGVYPMQDALADPTLMPDFPGLTNADNCRDWDAGFPIDVDRIREKDETYWDEFRGTPKAIITLEAGQQMWENRFGDLTSIRFRTGDPTASIVEEDVRSVLSPGLVGLEFEPVRETALAASSQSMDFGGLFIGFSFFLIIAALLLISLLFQFGVERRSREVGMLLAVGFLPNWVRRNFLGEALGLSVLGGMIGSLFGVLYAKGMVLGLTTIWSDAVASASLSFHGSVLTLAIGVVGSVLMAMGTLWWSLRKQFDVPARQLLAGGSDWNEIPSPGSKVKNTMRYLSWACLALAGGLVLWGVFNEVRNASGLFFGAGGLLLTGALLFSRDWLIRQNHVTSSLSDPSKGKPMSLARVALTNASRRIRRSVGALGLLACGSFLIASIGVFRLDAVKDAEQRSAGTGGFAFWGETSHPVNFNLNRPEGRGFFGLANDTLESVSFVSFRVKEGDDASCLNLNRAQQPRLVGVSPESLNDRQAFSFAKTMNGLPQENPWLLLNHEFADGAIPAIGDFNSILWALGKKIGDSVTYIGQDGREFQVRLVAGAANSILQGNLIIAEDHFAEKFPSPGGYQMFLIDAPAPQAAEVQATLTRALRDVGLELNSTVERMNAFNAVQNTYLSTFQLLGGLGLILGSAGLGVIVLRNVLERRGELALMRAVGFTRGRLKNLVMIEHLMLLIAGLGIGVIGALIAVTPSIIAPTADVPIQSLGLTLAGVFLLGMAWTWLATSFAVRGDLLNALRAE